MVQDFRKRNRANLWGGGGKELSSGRGAILRSEKDSQREVGNVKCGEGSGDPNLKYIGGRPGC